MPGDHRRASVPWTATAPITAANSDLPALASSATRPGTDTSRQTCSLRQMCWIVKIHGFHKIFTNIVNHLETQTIGQRHSPPNDPKGKAMTFFDSVMEFQSRQHETAPQPEPRSPEEVISLLAQEPPLGEYSVDAL